MKISASQLRTSEHATTECGPDAYMLTRTNSKNGKYGIIFYGLGLLYLVKLYWSINIPFNTNIIKHLFQILPCRKCLYSGRETINQLKPVLNYIMNAKMLGIVVPRVVVSGRRRKKPNPKHSVEVVISDA